MGEDSKAPAGGIDLGPFRALYPFASRHLDRGGLRLHFLDEGRGEPVLLLHGNPTWSFYFRSLVRGLSGTHRIVVPDHMGCGLSDKPDESAYGFRLKDRVEDFGALLEHLGLDRNLTLLVHDWGGAIGLAYAVDHPEAFRRLIVLNTAAFPPPAGKPLPLALKLARNLPLLSTPAILGANLFARLAVRTASVRGLSPEVRAGLLAPYRSWRHRLAIRNFVRDIPLGPKDPSFELIRRTGEGLVRLKDRPMLICWGGKDFVFDGDYLAEWVRRFPAAEVKRFPEAGHYLLEDAPEAVLAAVRDFLRRHPVG